MNKTGIEWCDYTWNPVTGCKHGCPYCYARKIAERFKGSKAWPEGFEPMFHSERLKDPDKLGAQYHCPKCWRKGSSIFVCSMADLFGDWVPYEWQHRVFDACILAPRHTYIFLTKNPAGMKKALEQWLDEHPGVIHEIGNWWFGVSAGDRDYAREGQYDPIAALRKIPSVNLFVSLEPLLMEIGAINLDDIKQVIVGAQTNPNKCAGLESILKICEESDRDGAKVFMKDSLAGRWPDRELRRELCWSVHK